MRFGERVKEMLELHEGLRLKPYRCTAGKLTIGVGRNLEDKGISRGEAYFLLDNDVAEVQLQLMKLPWYIHLDPVRQAVLINMAFNMGFDGLMRFKKMLAAIERGDWSTAAKEGWDSRWAFQVGDGPGKKEDRADQLMRMLETGVW